MRFARISNAELLSSLQSLVADERRLVTRVVAYLIEVEDRRLHLELACSSMFDFCTRKLRLSEGEAYRRLAVSRLARRFPKLLDAIESGDLHLSHVVLLRELFTEANVDMLIAAASGKSKREVQALIATLNPRPDVPSSIRKLPAPRPIAPRPTGNVDPAPSPSAVLSSQAPATRLPSPSPSPSASAAGTPPATWHSSPAPATAPAPRIAEQLEPLSEGRYKVQLTADTALREKLEHARALMRHRNPSGDLAVVVEAAVDLLVMKLEKEKLGATARPQAKSREASTLMEKSLEAKPLVQELRVDTPLHPKSPAPASAHVTRATRREVVARDDGQCSYLSSAGERCPAREFLELDHMHPKALGGSGEAPNIRLLCRAHNRHAAELVFGKSYVAEQIHTRQRKQNRPQCELYADPAPRPPKP